MLLFAKFANKSLAPLNIDDDFKGEYFGFNGSTKSVKSGFSAGREGITDLDKKSLFKYERTDCL